MPSQGFNYLPVAVSHSFTVLSALAVARILPSGLKLTPNLVCMPSQGFNYLTCGGIPQFHVLSALAVARILPSGLKLTPLTSFACPPKVFGACDIVNCISNVSFYLCAGIASTQGVCCICTTAFKLAFKAFAPSEFSCDLKYSKKSNLTDGSTPPDQRQRRPAKIRVTAQKLPRAIIVLCLWRSRSCLSRSR
jgi:hypothetical protein